MLGLKQRSELTAINIINAVLAVVLFFSPWLVGYRDAQIASWNAGTCGLVIGRLQEWEEWSSAALGLWTAAAPWIMGFTGSIPAMWAHVLVGLAVLALAAIELWLIHGSPPSKTA